MNTIFSCVAFYSFYFKKLVWYLYLTAKVLTWLSKYILLPKQFYFYPEESLPWFSSIQSLNRVRLFASPWTVAHQASLSITNSWSLLKLMSVSWWYHPTISPSVVPFSSHLRSFPASRSFPMSQFFSSGGQSIGVSASASVLPMNIQDWFPLGRTGWISLLSKGLSRVFSDITFQSKNSSALSFLYSPRLTFIHDCWQNQSFDYMDLCWQSNISAF